METPQPDQKPLHIRCRNLINELELPVYGSSTMLAQELSKRHKSTISLQTVSMAMTGNRKSAAYINLLEEIHTILQEKLEEKQSQAA